MLGDIFLSVWRQTNELIGSIHCIKHSLGAKMLCTSERNRFFFYVRTFVVQFFKTGHEERPKRTLKNGKTDLY